MLVNQLVETVDVEELVKSIRNECIIPVLFKQNKSYCNCRINACFHAGQLDLALKILRMTGFDAEKIKQLLKN